MRGTFVIALIVLVVLLSTSVAPDASRPASTPTRSTAGALPVAPAATPVKAGWHPFYQQAGQALDMALDSARGRIILTARFWVLANATNGSTQMTWSYNVLVLTLAGTVLYNVSIPSQPLYGGYRTIALDPATGYAYLPGYGYPGPGQLYRFDPGTGKVLKTWTYPQALDQVVYANGILASDSNGHSPILVINTTTGAIVANLSAYMDAWQDLVLDPAGRHLYAFSQGLVGGGVFGDVFRFDLPGGASTDLGVAGGAGSLSTDGRRLYVCGGPSYQPGENLLMTVTLANGSVSFGPSCGGLDMATNPKTDVVAFGTSGLLLDAAGADGAFAIWTPGPNSLYTYQAVDVAWTGDGSALVALSGFVNPIQIGTWDGTTWLGGPADPLVNPHWDPICFPFVTSEGVNGSAVTLFRDGFVLGAGTMGMTQACFGAAANPMLPLPDGDHVARISGDDKLGQPFDSNATFRTDGTPPVIHVLSSGNTTVTPYVLRGTLDEPHPNVVTVDGRSVPLAGDNWSASLDLVIGNSTHVVWANDTVGNYESLSFVMRYWPAFLDNLTDPAEGFQVALPPGWSGNLSGAYLQGGVNVTMAAPHVGVASARVLIYAIHAKVKEDSATALTYAWQAWNASVPFYLRGSAVIERLTVDGHPAAQFQYDVVLNGTPGLRVETFIVSALWQRVYVVVYDEPSYPAYGETLPWILQGFVVGPTGSGSTPGPSVLLDLLPWILLGIVGAVAAAAVAFVLLPRRKRGLSG